MAKITNWEDADNALRRIGEIDIYRERLNGELTLKINELKEEYSDKAAGLVNEKSGLETSISEFAADCKDEFVKTRSKTLNYGVIAYKVVRKVVIRSSKATLAALKALKLDSYIRIKEEPDKDALVGLDEKELVKIGAGLKIEDKLRIEPNLEKIKETY